MGQVGSTRTKIHRLIQLSGLKSGANGIFLITSKVLDALRQAQGRESFDSAQDREPVERPIERQMMP